jgi:predicted nucleic acid-binding protein
MSFVLDASVAGSWLIPDERCEAAQALGQRMLAEGAIAVDLFRHEVRNLLVTAVRRKRMPEDLLWSQLERIEAMPIEMAPSGPAARIITLALTHDLTAYDAAYLDLARERRLPLASFDDRLRRAAAAEGVTLIDG